MFSKIKKYFVDSYNELKKVNWPTRKETVNLTIIIIALSLFVAIFLGTIDIVGAYIIEKLVIK